MKQRTNARETLKQWGLRLWNRIRTADAPKPRLKDLWLVAVWLGGQSVAYLATRLVNTGLRHYQLETAWDRAIPLVPAFVLVYVGSYVFWGVSFALFSWDGRENRRRMAVSDLILNAICLVVFLAMPSTMTRPEVTGTGFCPWLLRLIYMVDPPDNLMPSLHCALSWLCWRGLRGSQNLHPWCGWVGLVCTLLVCAAVVLVKQHCLIDIPTGLLAAELSWQIGSRLTRNREE